MKKKLKQRVFGNHHLLDDPAFKKFFRIMRITILCFFLGLAQVMAVETYAQMTKLSMKVNNEPLEQVLKFIEDESEFFFLYNRDLIDVEQKVSVHAQDKTIKSILDEVLTGTDISFAVYDRQIVLTNTSVINEMVAQQKSVSGKVTDRNGQPLPGVTVLIKGTTNGTVTATNGNFSISNIPEGTTLVFSFVGMKTQEIEVGNQSSFSVMMEEESIGIEEVVAVGYGSVRKIDLAGSVGTVEVKSLVKAPVASFTDALAGRVAGVQVSSADGQPGRTPTIVIRGTNSLTQSTAPLYIIDGFPVENPSPSALNPEEIESISILKDASSAAIYGSRASNGVIIIKTKRGVTGAPVFNFSASYGVQLATNNIEVMDPYEFVRYIEERHPTYVDNYLKDGMTIEDYKNVKGVDWTDLVFNNGQVQMYNLSLRGGNEKTRYSVSGSIHDQKGIIINTGFDRYNGRFTIDHDFSPRVKLGITSNYSYLSSYGQTISSYTGSISSSALFRTWAYRPVDEELSEDFADQEGDVGLINSSDLRINPYIDLKNQHVESNSGLLESNGFLEIELIKDLRLKINGGIRRSVSQSEEFHNSKTTRGSNLNPSNLYGQWGKMATSNANSWVNEYILTYDKVFLSVSTPA